MIHTNEQSTRKKGRAWLILALVVAVLAFETMRELYVMEVNEPVRLMGPSLAIYGDTGFVHAEGVWRRSDDGSPMAQGSVVIECFRAWGVCIEVNNTYLPDIPALHSYVDVQTITSFSESAVDFSNSAPCADYRVRIDREQKRVLATRDKKSGAPEGSCGVLEQRVVMEMADGNSIQERLDATWTERHFLPIYRALIPFLR